MVRVRQSIQDNFQAMVALRRKIHANPETAYEEVETSKLVSDQLGSWKIEHENGWAETGIVATIEGNQPGPTIGLRADMDALNITETTGLEWQSQNSGKMHACGHDGHTVILLSALQALKENQAALRGTVKAIFQPGEEGAGGAKKMINQGILDKHQMDSIFALHNWSSMSENTMGVHEGAVMACADYFIIDIQGESGHAAMPSKAVNPLGISKAIQDRVAYIEQKEISKFKPTVIEITAAHGGSFDQLSVIPGTAKIGGTIRTFDPEVRSIVENRFRDIASAIASEFNGQATVEYHRGTDPTINDPEQARFCYDIAKRVLGNTNVFWNPPPEATAEDFGAFLEKIPGAYVWFGQKKPQDSPCNRVLHNSGYDFNEDIIPAAAEYTASLAEAKLGVAPADP